MAKTMMKAEAPASVGSISKINMSRASQLLGRYREEGKSIQHDLFPALNAALVAKGEGAMWAGVAVSKAQKDAVPSTLSAGQFSDTIVLKGIHGEKETVIFYASNGGTKMKISTINAGAGVLIVYRGDKSAQTKGFNDWHDFGIEEFPNAAALAEFLEAVSA